MNLFRLDNDPVIAARLNQDLHCKKIILEATQLLANCYSPSQLQYAPRTQLGNIRKYSHVHHPISKWVGQSYPNFLWTLAHAKELCREFDFRFGKKHFCQEFIDWCLNEQSHVVPTAPATEQPQCFKAYPECVVPHDPVAGYRNYYKTAKKSFDIRGKIVHATWTKRDVPEWFK